MHQLQLSALPLPQPTSLERPTTLSERLRHPPPVDSERRNSRVFLEVEEDSDSPQRLRRICSALLRPLRQEGCSEEEEDSARQRHLRSERQQREDCSAKLLNRPPRRSALAHQLLLPLRPPVDYLDNSRSRTRSVLPLPPPVDCSVNPLNQLLVVSPSVRTLHHAALSFH